MEKHDLALCRMTFHIEGVTVWATKDAKSLLKVGIPYLAINGHGIRAGYIALVNGNKFVDRTGREWMIPENLKKYL